MAGWRSTPYATARSRSMWRLSTSAVTWSEHSATSRTSRSASTEVSEPRALVKTTSLTGPASLASSSRTAVRSRSERMLMASRLYRPGGRAARHQVDTGTPATLPAAPPLRQSAEPGQPPGDPAEGLLDRLARGRVGEAEVALAVLAEGGAAEDGDPGLLQEKRGDLLRRPAEGLHVRQDVEGAPRPDARHPRDPVEPVHDEVPALAELRHHRLDRGVVALERGHSGLLDERRRAGRGVGHEACHVLGERDRHHAEAQPPARHGVRLREPVEDDRPLLHAREAGDRDELSLVEEPPVDLVREDGDAVVAGDLGDPRDLLGGEDAAGRILRRVDDDEARLLRDLPLEVGEVEAAAGLLEERDGHRDPAHEVDHRLV